MNDNGSSTPGVVPPAPETYVAFEGAMIAGKYRVERVLGRGGMGVVVAATHVQLKQRVAIKFLLAAATPEVVERFLREARAVVRLKSDYVARVTDVGALDDGAPYMVMEYLDGCDLAEVLKRRGPLDPKLAVEHVLHACDAIAEAHAAGIVHRDLKPANLFLTTTAGGSARVKVLDFGISKASAEGAGGLPEMALTRTQAVLGSPLYMSPEQMRSPRTVDPRSDIWSLGAILYELTTGHVPFNAYTLPELVLKVTGETPPPPSHLRPGMHPLLEAAILRCLEKDPAARFPSVAALAEAIAPFGPADSLLAHARLGQMGSAGPLAPSLPAGLSTLVLPSAPPFPASAVTSNAVVLARDLPRQRSLATIAIAMAGGTMVLVAALAITTFRSGSPSVPASAIGPAAGAGAAVSAPPPATPPPQVPPAPGPDPTATAANSASSPTPSATATGTPAPSARAAERPQPRPPAPEKAPKDKPKPRSGLSDFGKNETPY